METLSHHHIMVMFLSLGILLGVARLLGELAQRLHQPSVLGELLAGVLLGPTILGNIAPGFSEFLFPSSGPNAIALEAIATLAVVLFLLVAGIEVDLSTIWRQGSVGLKIGITSMVVPFLFGFAAAWFIPRMLGRQEDADALVFALFFATALSISALPVIAKTLMDMDLYRSDMGMIVISAAIFNDIVGWVVFAIILGMMGTATGQDSGILITIVLTLVFAGSMLTVGRWIIHKLLPYLQAYTKWPGGVLGFALTLALLGAAFTEWIGIHAIFGSFLVGVAIGDSSHLRERTRVTIEHFVSFIFAPVFFASIGLKVDFLAHFDFFLVVTVLIIACVCKLLGGMVGARWGGMSPRDSWAVGFALNSRGAMEIILGLLALTAGIINQPLFVALVVMAIVTSMMSGPLMRVILNPNRKRSLEDAMSSKLFVADMKAASRREAIRELVALAAESAGLDNLAVESAVWMREETMSTGIGNGVALPHARIRGLEKPMVVIGISTHGIDFDAPDDRLAHVIYLILTPEKDARTQLELTAEIARFSHDLVLLEKMQRARNYTDFLALIKSVAVESEPEAT